MRTHWKVLPIVLLAVIFTASAIDLHNGRRQKEEIMGTWDYHWPAPELIFGVPQEGMPEISMAFTEDRFSVEIFELEGTWTRSGGDVTVTPTNNFLRWKLLRFTEEDRNGKLKPMVLRLDAKDGALYRVSPPKNLSGYVERYFKRRQ